MNVMRKLKEGQRVFRRGECKAHTLDANLAAELVDLISFPPEPLMMFLQSHAAERLESLGFDTRAPRNFEALLMNMFDADLPAAAQAVRS